MPASRRCRRGRPAARAGQAQLHRGQQGLAAGQQLGAGGGAACAASASGGGTFEGECVHGVVPPSGLLAAACSARPAIASHTRCGEAGMSRSFTPSGPQRVEHGVDHRRRRADRAGLAAALGAQRVVGAGRADGVELEVRQVVGPRHGVVHEGAGRAAGRFLVVHAVLHQRLADALRDAAVHLALDDHRVDDGAEVVDRGEAVDATSPVRRVDLDLADVGAGRDR